MILPEIGLLGLAAKVFVSDKAIPDNLEGLMLDDIIVEGQLLLLRNPLNVGRSTGIHIELTICHQNSAINPEEVIKFPNK